MLFPQIFYIARSQERLEFMTEIIASAKNDEVIQLLASVHKIKTFQLGRHFENQNSYRRVRRKIISIENW